MELFLPFSLELTTHHNRCVKFDMDRILHTLFTREIDPISFLYIRVANEYTFFSARFKFVPLGRVVIDICLAAKWAKFANIGFLAIASLIRGAILKRAGDVSIFRVGHIVDCFGP